MNYFLFIEDSFCLLNINLAHTQDDRSSSDELSAQFHFGPTDAHRLSYNLRQHFKKMKKEKKSDTARNSVKFKRTAMYEDTHIHTEFAILRSQ